MTKLPPIKINQETFFKKNFTLPPLPSVVNRMQEIIQSEDVNIKEVSRLLNEDPALAVRVLRVFNSDEYTFPKRIVDISFAVAYLGINEVYRIVLPYAVVKTLDIKDRTSFDIIWKHSVYTALCVRYLAKKYEPLLSPDILWSAALLHDIGKFVYLKFFPKHYKAIYKIKREKRYFFCEAEEELSLPSSSYFGVLLCEHWQLSKKIKMVCKSHSIKELVKIKKENSVRAFIKIVTLGNLMAILAKNTLEERNKECIVKLTCKELDCSKSDFLVLMGDIYDLEYKVDMFL